MATGYKHICVPYKCPPGVMNCSRGLTIIMWTIRLAQGPCKKWPWLQRQRLSMGSVIWTSPHQAWSSYQNNWVSDSNLPRAEANADHPPPPPNVPFSFGGRRLPSAICWEGDYNGPLPSWRVLQCGFIFHAYNTSTDTTFVGLRTIMISHTTLLLMTELILQQNKARKSSREFTLVVPYPGHVLFFIIWNGGLPVQHPFAGSFYLFPWF